MASKIIVMGSSIEPRIGKFSYSKTRSHFSAEERLRQTLFSVNSLRNCISDSKIVIVDSSNDHAKYSDSFKYFSNVEYIPLKELDYNAFELVNTHQHKSVCEAVLLNTYYNHYKKEVLSYDYHIRAVGRYFYWNLKESIFNEENKNKMFFKPPVRFKWDDSWQYHHVDLRNEFDHCLNQFCTVLYAFGTKHLHKFIDINEAVIHLLNRQQMAHYDIEILLYYLTREYRNNIITTDWLVSGWDGVSGKFMHY